MSDQMTAGHRMLWGALGHDVQARLRTLARDGGAGPPEPELVAAITRAWQSLEIDGRAVPPVLSAERDEQGSEHLGVADGFVEWIREHEGT